MNLEVFVDLTRSGLSAGEIIATIETWQRPESLGCVSGQVRVLARRGVISNGTLPAGSGWCLAETDNPRAVLDHTLRSAGRRGSGVLVLSGAVDVTCEALGELQRRLSRDPMFGFAIPRVACADRCCIAALTQHGAGSTEWIPRKVLSDLPESEIFVETLAPCVLIAPQVAANFGPLEPEFSALGTSVLHYMAVARRCGFRTVLCNRAVVGGDDLACGSVEITPVPELSPSDRERLARLIPDLERSWGAFRAAGWQRFERLCGAMPRPHNHSCRPSLLIDVRNVVALHNGTSQAVLGLVSAFRDQAKGWDVALLADPVGAEFHDYARLYPGWPVYTSCPERVFTVALRPSQPWHIQEMADLHHSALINAYLVLDTISWDIGYCAPQGLEGAWLFLADHADGLLYDSEFTRRRFVERFPTSATVPNRVANFSFEPREYKGTSRGPQGASQFVLVVGNHLDHKDVRQTVATLASAFPYQRISALGPVDVTSPFVTARKSGTLSEQEIQRLYADARYVVYPSFYEGFGFPIVSALANGRTVLARRSALLEELAGHCDGAGRLIAFDSREELVELLGRLLHGEPVAEIPLGTARDGSPVRTWADVARETHDFLSTLVTDSARRHWIARERALSQWRSFRGRSDV